MTEIIKPLQAISVLLFPVASMLAVGLSFTFRQLAGPLRYPDRVFRALVANFILVPLLALGISRLLALDPSLAAGMVLVGMAAGAPFLLKLTQAANADVGLSASLLVLLMPLTVIYMPFVVPLVVADASVRALGIAVPLILTLLLPMVIGHTMDSFLPRLAARLRPIAGTTSSIALVVLIASTLVLNAPLFRDLLGTGAIAATVLLTAGGFGVGYLISSPGFNRRVVMGLGAGQRNIAAALVVASQDFDDPRTLVMVVLFSVVDLMVLFPIALILRRRSPTRPPPPTHGGHAAPPRGRGPDATRDSRKEQI
jgi:BASS family bile acid:Na+ symporter